MPKMVFHASCAKCGEERKFIEFKIEACSPDSVNAPRSRYGFMCMSCRTIVPEIRDKAGAVHQWAEGKHVEVAP